MDWEHWGRSELGILLHQQGPPAYWLLQGWPFLNPVGLTHHAIEQSRPMARVAAQFHGGHRQAIRKPGMLLAVCICKASVLDISLCLAGGTLPSRWLDGLRRPNKCLIMNPHQVLSRGQNSSGMLAGCEGCGLSPLPIHYQACLVGRRG